MPSPTLPLKTPNPGVTFGGTNPNYKSPGGCANPEGLSLSPDQSDQQLLLGHYRI